MPQPAFSSHITSGLSKTKLDPSKQGNISSELFQAIADGATYVEGGRPQEDALIPLTRIGGDIEKAIADRDRFSRVNIAKLPGNTPEEKAYAYASIASKVSKEEYNWGGQGYREQLRQFNAQAIQQAAEGLEELEGNETGGAALNPSGAPMHEFVSQLSWEDAQALRQLATLKKIGFSLHKPSKKTRNVEGDEIDYDQIESIDQMFDADYAEFRPKDEFKRRLVNHELMVPLIFKKDKAPKKVYALLIDRSGSMHTDTKIGMVRAMLLTLFKEVDKGAVLYISTFEEGIDGWHRVATKEEAVEYYSTLKSPRGGNTEVGKCIAITQAEIAKRHIGEFQLEDDESPEIIIVNDGQDTIHPTPTIAPVHAISIEQDNPALKALCLKSKGQYFNI